MLSPQGLTVEIKVQRFAIVILESGVTKGFDSIYRYDVRFSDGRAPDRCFGYECNYIEPNHGSVSEEWTIADLPMVQCNFVEFMPANCGFRLPSERLSRFAFLYRARPSWL